MDSGEIVADIYILYIHCIYAMHGIYTLAPQQGQVGAKTGLTLASALCSLCRQYGRVLVENIHF